MGSTSHLLALSLAGAVVAGSLAQAQVTRGRSAGAAPPPAAGATAAVTGGGSAPSAPSAPSGVSGGTNTSTPSSPETIGTGLAPGNPGAGVDDGAVSGSNDTTYQTGATSRNQALGAYSFGLESTGRLPDGRLNGEIWSGPLDSKVGGATGGTGPN